MTVLCLGDILRRSNLIISKVGLEVVTLTALMNGAVYQWLVPARGLELFHAMASYLFSPFLITEDAG